MKTALVLSGGGALGAWQVGAIKALLESGIQFDQIVGTSVGSVNGAAIAMNSFSELEDLWLSLKSTKDVQKAAWWKNFWASGLYHFGPLKSILKKRLAEIKPDQIPMYACYTDLKSGKLKKRSQLECKSRDEFIEYILASSSLGFFHEPISLPNGDYGVDGGHRAVLPIEMVEGSVDRIIAIGTVAVPESLGEYNPKFPKIVNNGMRTLGIMTVETYNNDFAGARRSKKNLILAPSKPLPYDGMDYNVKNTKAMIKQGREEALEQLGRLN